MPEVGRANLNISRDLTATYMCQQLRSARHFFFDPFPENAGTARILFSKSAQEPAYPHYTDLVAPETFPAPLQHHGLEENVSA